MRAGVLAPNPERFLRGPVGDREQTDSFSALWEKCFHGGTTKTSFGPHSSTLPSTVVVPLPSTQTKIEPSVARYFSPLKPFGSSARPAPMVGSTGPPLMGLAYRTRAP